MSYATDGKCHNSEPGTFNHECGKPATWIGTTESGFQSGFCDDCKRNGHEARGMAHWHKIPRFVGLDGDWTRTPTHRPWARDLNRGDFLTDEQAACIQETRLADFGLRIVNNRVESL